jgi:flagellar biosynthetic protein FlhB
MSAQERTEPASDKRLRDARKRGEVARSQDLSGALLFVLAVLTVVWTGGSVASAIVDGARHAFGTAARGELGNHELVGALGFAAARAAGELALPLAVLAVGAALFPFLQLGPVLALDPLTPKLERLGPLAGLKRMVLSAEAWVELAKSLLRIGAILALAWQLTRSEFDELVALSRVHPWDAARWTGALATRVLTWTAILGLAFGALDFFWQRHVFAKRMRMSKEERKREYEEQEGDPHVRAARRELHHEIVENAMLEQVPEADFCLRNPTHLACAMRYAPGEDAAPRLLAKGQEGLAERIEAIAREHGVPIVHDIPLARAVYRLELDEQIPEDLYAAAIEVMRWVEAEATSRGRQVSWKRENQDATHEDEPR